MDPDHGAPIGYLGGLSAEPGESVGVHMYCSLPWTLDLVRLIHGDPRPDGKGLTEEVVAGPWGPFPPVTPSTQPGSLVRTGLDGECESLAVHLWVHPTLPPARGREQTLIAATGWSLGVDSQGHLSLWLSGPEPVQLSAPAPLVEREWYLVEAIVDPRGGAMTLRLSGAEQAWSGEAQISTDAGTVAAPSVIGGTTDAVIHAPCWTDRPLRATERERIRAGEEPLEVLGEDLLAAWSFPSRGGRYARTVGKLATPGELVNGPVVAVPGPHAGVEPTAARFHSDALTDAGWPASATIELPGDLRSGVYAIRARSEAGVDRAPLVVLPDAGTRNARVALLLPTMTYLAYANEAQPGQSAYLHELVESARPTAIDRWLARHPEFGRSLYDRHADGSGVTLSSPLRPIPNHRPDYLHWLSGEPRHLGADLYIVDWLERIGLAFDVITDHDLDSRGAALIEPYRVVLTGSHPEYFTATMLDALERHLGGGGRLMYLGGNGFYWVTSTHPDRPGEIEVRRGRNGWPWASEPGEEAHAFTGERGGHWGARGRPARELVGLTFLAMGSEDPAPPYRRTAASYDEGLGWIFEGLDDSDPVIGARGRLMGGAAGHEIDCAHVAGGPPDGATVIARSSDHSKWLTTSSELAQQEHGIDADDLHADLVYFRRPAGGEVFSVGSICWCGALPTEGGDPAVARVTENVLRRFIESSRSSRP